MSDPETTPSISSADLLVEQRRRWEMGDRVSVESLIQRWPTLDMEAILDLIGHELILRQESGEKPKVEDYVARFPQWAEQLRMQFEVEQALNPMSEPANPGPDPATPLFVDSKSDRTQPSEPSIPGYEIMERLGRGGQSIVYKARHLGLNRLVAVKMILGGANSDPEDRMRFRREAEAAAQLQHPHIAQIFDVGEQAGLPYLTLEYVSGGTLAKRLANTPQSAKFTAEIVETLARTIHVAHQAGIVHRDLKPGNILLQTDGTPKIIDFGLAKRLEPDATLTHSGLNIMGTPRYMAPEQAAGLSKNVGPSADIYALGSILYEMLTGRTPFAGETILDVLDQVRAVDPVAPRRLQPAIPADLETICLKCLQKSPALRYSSAEALADDLRRFLTDRPILARRAGSLERLARWCRREAKVARLTAAVVAVVVVALLAVGVLGLKIQHQGTKRIDAAIAEMDQELEIIGREEFALVPQNDQIRRQLLEGLAAKCQTLTNTKSDHPELRRKQAEVQSHLGTIYELLGRYEEAESGYREAAQLLRSGRSSDRDPADRRALARSYDQLANLLVSVGRLDEADRLYHQALDLQSQPTAGDEELQTERAETLHRLGSLQVMTGRLEEGEQSLKQALELRRELANAQPETASRQLALAQTETGLATLLTTLSRFAEAGPLFDAAVERQDKLAARATNVPVYRLGTARSLAGRGRMLELSGFSRPSTVDLLRAHEIFKKLADDHPHRPEYRQELAAAAHNIAFPIGTDIEKRYREAVAEQERLVAQYPAVVENHRRLALTLNSLATWLSDVSVDYPGYRKHWLWTFIFQVKALETHRRSNAIWQKLATDYPTVLAYQNGLAMSHQRFGILLGSMGRRDEAEKIYRESIAIQMRLAEKYPKVAAHFILLSALHNNLGVVYDRRKDLKSAEEYFRRSIEYGRQARQINPQNPSTRFNLSIQERNMAEILVRTGRHQEAFPWIEDAPKLWVPNVWNGDSSGVRSLFDLIMECVEAANKDSSLTSAQRAALVRRYEDLMIAQIKMVAEHEQQHIQDIPDFLRKAPCLKQIRDREEFQAFCHEFEANVVKKP